MTVETRYFRTDRDPVIAAYWRLLTSNTAAFAAISGFWLTTTVQTTGYVRVQVYIYHADTTLTFVAEGAPVTVTGSSPALYSNTLSVPEISPLVSTDKVIVILQYSPDGSTWASMTDSVFTTEELGTTILNSSTWTVTYYCAFTSIYNPAIRKWINTVYFYFGDATYPSRIENFTYGVTAIAKIPYGDGLTFAD